MLHNKAVVNSLKWTSFVFVLKFTVSHLHAIGFDSKSFAVSFYTERDT